MGAHTTVTTAMANHLSTMPPMPTTPRHAIRTTLARYDDDLPWKPIKSVDEMLETQ